MKLLHACRAHTPGAPVPRVSCRAQAWPMLCAALLAAAPLAHGQQVAHVEFNEAFLSIGGDQQSADLSLFAMGNHVMPGTYAVDVMLNESRVGQYEIAFAAVDGRAQAAPCVTRPMLDSWGVNVSVFVGLAASAPAACVDVAAIIPDAALRYDDAGQRLYVSMPQAALKRTARGAVSPERWDRGIDAAMLDYQLSLSRYDGSKFRQPGPDLTSTDIFASSEAAPNRLERNTVFGGLRGGFNLGDWRFRHFSTYNRGMDGQGRWQAINTSLQRDLIGLRSQLLLGDGSTPGNLFDSVQFRGAQIQSDDAMLPDSLQGYAPTIRGVAQTNARVEVRQNGYLIYSTYVAPGQFVLDDLYPTSSSGDLEVTVVEADGRRVQTMQAFSAVPTLLREGAWRYSATAGQYRDGFRARGDDARPLFVQGTIARGLPRDFSLYGGLTVADRYWAALLGGGKNLRHFGAVSVDLSHARTTDARDNSYQGQSLRFLYSKSFERSGTDFRVAGYRYSTSGYRTFQEAVQMRDPLDSLFLRNRRNELRLEVAQQLAGNGSVYASARQQSYWGTNAKDRLVQIGYSGQYRQLGYNLFFNRSTNPYGSANRQVMLTLSIPLGSSRHSAQYSVTRDSEGRVDQQASVYGSAFDDSRLTYNLTAGRSNQSGANGSANLSYLSRVGRLELGRSQGRGYGQTSLSMAGGVLVHGGGVTLSQPLGETMALVQAPDAQDVGFEVRPGVRTDSRGYAVVPHLSPYRLNRLAVLTRDLNENIEVRNAALELVPTRGAITLARFDTLVGYRMMMTLSAANGAPLPFGSKIEDEAGTEVGIVGPDGQAFVTGASQSGRLTVIWGRGERDRCSVRYSLSDPDTPTPIRELDGQCE